MTLLIAGFGDLGRALAQTCHQTVGWQTLPILAVRRHPPNETPQPNVSWIKADLDSPASLDILADQLHRVTHVVYCAAPSERTEAAYRATYLHGLQNLVQAFKALQFSSSGSPSEPPKLLFVSSTAVYDSQGQGVFDESSPTLPGKFNGQILLEAENWLMANWPGALILRLSGIYGPSKQSLLASIRHGTATVPDGEDYVANRIHIDDAARAILHLFDSGQQGIFIGTDNHPLPLRELYSKLAKILGVPAPPIGPPSPMMGKKSLSNRKLLSSGFELKWPDCLQGYKDIIANHLS
jgi:nucleoside-diphosphate-sugar epimerase